MASSLITADDMEVHAQSGLPLERLEADFIDPLDAEIIRRAGPHGADERTLEVETDGLLAVTLPRPASVVTTVEERSNYSRRLDRSGRRHGLRGPLRRTPDSQDKEGLPASGSHHIYAGGR